MHSERVEPARVADAATRPYEPPRLVVLGSVRDLTRGATGSYMDGAGQIDGGGQGSLVP